MLSPLPSSARPGKAVTAALLSLTAIVLLSLALVWLSGGFSRASKAEQLVVFCAAGVRGPVEELAAQYEEELGVPVLLQYGSSGSLLNQLEVDSRADLYIPADDSFVTMSRDKQLISESIPLAEFRLVLAVKPGNPHAVANLDDALGKQLRLGAANANAAVGKLTQQMLQQAGRWEEVEQALKVIKPTVTDVALDVKESSSVDAAFMWDSTARQFGLDIVDLPELAGGEATITAAVTATCERPADALRFARYLAAPEKGNPRFAEHHYQPIAGDAWAVKPQVVLFSGGVNRIAIEDSLREFEHREGCTVGVSYNGCGVLVAEMKAGQIPDAYFACDQSFVDTVHDLFVDATVVSRTDMVMLVRPGNPKNIHTLADLAREGMEVGLADEERSALGALTKQLLQEVGIYEPVRANLRSSSGTADLLVAQLLTGKPLDAVIVYRANCSQVGDAAEIVAIDHPRALAVQPYTISKQSRHAQISRRLLEKLRSDLSQRRFSEAGFEWMSDAQHPASLVP